MLPLAFRLDHHAHVVALPEGAHRVDRRAEVDDIQAPAQVLGQRRLQELDDDVLPLLADIDAGRRVGQIDDDAALAGAPAAEVDVADRMLGVAAAVGEARRLAARRGLADRRLGKGDQHVAAIDTRFVRHGAAQIEHQARAVGALHDIHAAQLALADLLRGTPEAVRGVRKVEGDARRIGDGKIRRHVRQGLLGGDPHDGLAALLAHVEALDGVRLGGSETHAHKPQQVSV